MISRHCSNRPPFAHDFSRCSMPGNNIAARTAMMAMTTSSSISVNADLACLRLGRLSASGFREHAPPDLRFLRTWFHCFFLLNFMRTYLFWRLQTHLFNYFTTNIDGSSRDNVLNRNLNGLSLQHMMASCLKSPSFDSEHFGLSVPFKEPDPRRAHGKDEAGLWHSGLVEMNHGGASTTCAM